MSYVYSLQPSASSFTSNLSSEFLKRCKQLKSTMLTGSLFQMLTTLSPKKEDRAEQLL